MAPATTPDSYLIIGGCGFLGGHIVDLLLQRGEPAVAVFDVVTRDVDPRAAVFSGDMTDETVVRDVIQKCAATCIIVPASVIDAPRHIMDKVNVGGIKNIIKLAVELGVEKLVYTSSASVVFDGADQPGVDETAPYPTRPFDDYCATKAIAEKLILEANGQGALRTTSLRVAGLFGTHDRLTVTSFMNVLVTGKHTSQLGNNQNKWEWTYIVNAASAHLLAADRLDPSHPKHDLVAGQAFFITNGDPWPFWNLPRALWKASGHQLEQPRIIPYFLAWIIGFVSECVAWITGKPPLLTRNRVTLSTTTRWCNIDKARRALDYTPEISVQEGVERSVKWWMSEHPTFQGAGKPL